MRRSIRSFFSMLGHIARAAAKRNSTSSCRSSNSPTTGTDYELSNRADGLILLGYGDYLRYADRLRHLAETDAHFVIWGPVVENQPGHYLCCDNDFGARLATRHLLAQGRRKIAFVGGASDQWPEFKLRHRGYTEALHEAGLGPDPRLHAEAQSSEAAGYSAG